MMTLQKRLAKPLCTATCEWIDSNPNMTDMPAGSTHYKVTLRRAGRRLTVPFSMGPAHCKEPTAIDVMSCLISDSAGVDGQGFEDWARDLGYDADSRKAEKLYRACERQAAKLRQFLGEDYHAFLYETEAY